MSQVEFKFLVCASVAPDGTAAGDRGGGMLK